MNIPHSKKKLDPIAKVSKRRMTIESEDVPIRAHKTEGMEEQKEHQPHENTF